MTRRIVLASTSPFRAALLERLGLEFETFAPSIDESAVDGESAETMVSRLARAKAKTALATFPDALVIGSDQVSVCRGHVMGKPGTHENAMRQLKAASGQTVRFLTGLCVLDTSTGVEYSVVEPYEVIFRDLKAKEIASYLLAEQPYNCAGAFKSEALGVALFRAMRGDDPNSLIGLPLIRLVELLARHDFDVLEEQALPSAS